MASPPLVRLTSPEAFASRTIRRAWDGARRARRLFPWCLLAFVFTALLVHTQRYYPFLSDDALISLRYARRLADGLGLTWTDGERVEGYTNLLWVLLTGLCGFVGFDLIGSARVLGTIGVLLAVACASCVPRPLSLSPMRTVTAGLFCALSAPLAVWAVGGLEHGFLSGMLACALLALGRIDPRGEWSLRACFLAGAFLGAVALLRADGLVLAVAAATGLALAGRLGWRALGAGSIVLAVPVALVGLQLLFRLVYYDALVPNTALVKVSFNEQRLIGGLYYLRDGYRPLIPAFVLTAAAVLAGARRMRAERAVPAGVVIVAWSAYLAFVGGDIFPGWRQLVPVVVALGMLLAEAAPAAAQAFRHGRIAVPVVAVGSLVAGLFVQNVDRENLRAKNELWPHGGRPVGNLLRRAFGAKRPLLAVDAAGALPFWSGLPSLDMLGLNDRYIATHPPPGFGTGPIGHEIGDGAYVLGRRPDIIAFNGSTGARDPMFLSGRQLVGMPEFQRRYQLVRARAPKSPIVGELWLLREGGRLGVARAAERIDVPGYFFTGEHVFAELEASGELVAKGAGASHATLPSLMLPAGTWELVLESDDTSDVTFRCAGNSAVLAGAPAPLLVVEEPATVDVTVRAGANGALTIRRARFVRSSGPRGGYRCWDPAHRLVVQSGDLGRRKTEHSEWDAPDNVIFSAMGLRVEFSGLKRAARIELSLDGNDRYRILFARGSQVEGFATVEPRKGGGMSVRTLAVPRGALATGFDRVEIVPLEGDGQYSLGHLSLAD